MRSLRKHQGHVDGFDRDQNPEEFECQQCEEGDEESTLHLMTNCPAFTALRADYLGYPTREVSPNDDPFEQWTVQQVISFIGATELYVMMGKDVNGNEVNLKPRLPV